MCNLNHTRSVNHTGSVNIAAFMNSVNQTDVAEFAHSISPSFIYILFPTRDAHSCFLCSRCISEYVNICMGIRGEHLSHTGYSMRSVMSEELYKK